LFLLMDQQVFFVPCSCLDPKVRTWRVFPRNNAQAEKVAIKGFAEASPS